MKGDHLLGPLLNVDQTWETLKGQKVGLLWASESRKPEAAYAWVGPNARGCSGKGPGQMKLVDPWLKTGTLEKKAPRQTKKVDGLWVEVRNGLKEECESRLRHFGGDT